MKNFKFLNQAHQINESQPEDVVWTGASWFWNEVNEMRVDGLWTIERVRSTRGLRHFLSTFDENRIIPIHAIFYENQWYCPTNQNHNNFHLGIMNEDIIIVYYRPAV